MDIKTLREFEQRLLPERTSAASGQSWEQYERDMLPLGDRDNVLIHQGFDAGFTAAMNRVRVLLNQLQTEALRRPDPDPWAEWPKAMAAKKSQKGGPV